MQLLSLIHIWPKALAAGLGALTVALMAMGWALSAQLGEALSLIHIYPEQVLAWDPDIIFIDFNGMDLISEDYASNPDFYNALTAVQEGRVYSQISFLSLIHI